MVVIFDIKSDKDWASSINEEIQNDFPNFFVSNLLIGSDDWWATVEVDITKGRITHVGHQLEDGELIDVVNVQPLDDDLNGDDYLASQPELSFLRESYWLHKSVQTDKLLQIKSVTICPSGELDENALYIETEICVW